MCHVLANELLEPPVTTHTECDGAKVWRDMYYSWRLDFHGLLVRQWKYQNNDQDWKVDCVSPQVHGVRHGWCIDYMDGYRSDYKQCEGWFHMGKKHGPHRKYAVSHEFENGRKQYLREIVDWDHGVMQRIQKFNSTGHLMHVWHFKNGTRHGIQFNHLQKFASLEVNGEIVVKDLSELHIDYENITDADIFTLTMLGL